MAWTNCRTCGTRFDYPDDWDSEPSRCGLCNPLQQPNRGGA